MKSTITKEVQDYFIGCLILFILTALIVQPIYIMDLLDFQTKGMGEWFAGYVLVVLGEFIISILLSIPYYIGKYFRHGPQ